jgi:thioredoxin-like negative regulator of GroEL
VADDEIRAAIDAEPTSEQRPRKRTSPSVVLLLLVAAILAGIAFAKVQKGGAAAPPTTAASVTSGTSQQTATTITSVHNDAVADYDAALKSGKPVYVLFHSLSCQPCVEISAVVDKVMPGYAGKVVFVNAISDDASAQQLASKFKFQYIPTSFFVKADGTTVDSFTGSMSETDMRTRLDKLVAK